MNIHLERSKQAIAMKTKRLGNGHYSVIIDDHEYIAKYMPEGNQWVPWTFFIYKDRNGNPRGTTGQGYRTKQSVMEAIVKWHTNDHYWDGWLSPEGKFFEVAYSQHAVILDLHCPNANGDYYKLTRKGWLLMRSADFPTEWHLDNEITSKQWDWIEAWCKRTNRELPEICKSRSL